MESTYLGTDRGKRKFESYPIECEENIDSGNIWHQISLNIPKHFLYDEINRALFDVELQLIDWAIDNFDIVQPYAQDKNIVPTYRNMRTPKDSEVDIALSIGDQFDLIRVCDPERYPAFFKIHGFKYQIHLKKIDD